MEMVEGRPSVGAVFLFGHVVPRWRIRIVHGRAVTAPIGKGASDADCTEALAFRFPKT